MSNLLNLLNQVKEAGDKALQQAQANCRAFRTSQAKRVFAAAQHAASTFDQAETFVSIAGGTMYLTISLRNLSSLKDPLLVKALETFDNEEPHYTSSQDYPGVNERDFRFTYQIIDRGKELTTMICVSIEARFKEDSATCRKVMVGYTEPTPQPIYEIRCED